MKMFSKYISFTLVIASLFFSAANLALADGGNPGDYLHNRTYIGVLGTSVSVGNTGLFSGTNYSRVDFPAYDLSIIPSLSQAIGWGFLAGHREEAYALEVSYWNSTHTATFGPGTFGSNYGGSATFSSAVQGTAVYNSINIDFKRYFLTDLQFQPFLDLGVSFPWITINNADVDGSGNFYPLTISGLGLDLGVGVEYYFSPTLSLVAGAYQRWASFDQFKGSQIEYNTLDTDSSSGANTSHDGSGLNFTVGITLGVE